MQKRLRLAKSKFGLLLPLMETASLINLRTTLVAIYLEKYEKENSIASKIKKKELIVQIKD